MSVVNLVTAPLSLVTVNVAFGSGAAVGVSDPALIGPGRIGVTRTTPVIPVFPAFESLRATDAHTIRNNKLTATIQRHIFTAFSLPQITVLAKIFLDESFVFAIEPDRAVSSRGNHPTLVEKDWRSDATALLLSCELKRKKPVRQKQEDFHHNVYVVLLRNTVAKHSSILRLNPKRDPLKPCVYVGMTGIPVDHRFENHKNGYKSAWVVRKYGVRLIPELYEHLNPMPFEAAVQMELELAEDLRAAGYTVTGGH